MKKIKKILLVGLVALSLTGIVGTSVGACIQIGDKWLDCGGSQPDCPRYNR